MIDYVTARPGKTGKAACGSKTMPGLSIKVVPAGAGKLAAVGGLLRHRVYSVPAAIVLLATACGYNPKLGNSAPSSGSDAAAGSVDAQAGSTGSGRADASGTAATDGSAQGGGRTGAGGGGSVGSGGAIASGGTVGSGGTIASAGSVGSGGTIASAGSVGSGGTISIAGSVGSGGTIASAGTVGSGGATATGGAAGTGGAASTASLAGDPTTLPFGSVTIGQKSAAQSVVISNLGQLASDPLALAIDGTDFAIDPAAAGDCSVGMKLAGGSSCTVHVVFAPSTSGARSGTLTVSGAPGGTVDTSLSGSGATPGALASSAKAIDFASTPVGTSVTKGITVTNSGETDVTGVKYSVTDGGTGQFSRTGNAAGDCGATIAAGASCALRVTFAASTPGTVAGVITVTPANTGPVSATLAGVALGPALLSGDPAAVDFGEQEIKVASPEAKTWTITNIGEQPTTSVPTLTSSAEVSISTTCKAALQPRASCTVTLTFTPSAGGLRTAILTAASGESSAKLNVTAKGMIRLTINKNVGESACSTCSVRAADASHVIDCGATCSGLFEPNSRITLQATTTNGSGHWFSGWTGTDTDCSGPGRGCTLSLGPSSRVVGASFPAMTNNLIFTSSTVVSTAAGSAKAYDTICNTLASTAGINNTSGNGYVAWVSDSNSLAATRAFPSASTQGWVRMDGRVFATTKNDLLNNSVVISPVLFDEMGQLNWAIVITGTKPDGTLPQPPQDCNSWTSSGAASGMMIGQATGGPDEWTYWGNGACTQADPKVMCMGIASSAPVAMTPSSGKRIWTTAAPFIPGSGGTPDAWCASHAPVGVSGTKALLARVGSTAGSLLTPTAVYVRLDGQRVGTGAEIVYAGGGIVRGLDTGIWQDNLGAYKRYGYGYAWTGAKDLDTAGTAASTCGNWIDPSLAALYGASTSAASDFFIFSARNNFDRPCNVTGDAQGVLYCIEL
jgi:hypothetical protein